MPQFGISETVELQISGLFPEGKIDSGEEKKTFLDTMTATEKKNEFQPSSKPYTSLHDAVFKNDLETVELLLKNGEDPNNFDQLGRQPLHCAAIVSSNQMLEVLIQHGATVNSKIQNVSVPRDAKYLTPKNTGRTALHISTAQMDYNCIKTLLQKGADVDCIDLEGQTPLLTIGEKSRAGSENSKKQYEQILDLLLASNAKVNVFANNGLGPLHRALEFESIDAFRQLLQRGVDSSVKDNNGDTILHEICKSGKEDFAAAILHKNPSLINVKNQQGDTPLHCAALAASRSCLTLLINNGGDLSQTNLLNLTVCHLIVSNIPRPLNFLVETLDSKLIPNECSINDKDFTVSLDFQMLTPNDGQQMSVLIALINSLPYEQKPKIVLHPLIATFIKLKWVKLRILFFILVIIHLMFVMSLSLHVCFLIKGQSMFIHNWSRYVLLFTSAIILTHILTEMSLAPRYFIKEFETWLTLTCVTLSLTMGIWETFFITTPIPPDWIRHLAAYDVLLSWILLMFVLGRFPLMGYFALMFFTVLKNVVKVLLFFTCLVIGFSLSFCVQFNDMQFDDPWKAFVRTTIMLMGEYEYSELFNEDKIMKRFEVSGALFPTSRITFLLFVLLGSIVLMNLMTGLAVNDIQGLQAEGCLRHMIKQAEFIAHIEKISLKNVKRKLIPCHFRKILQKRQNLPRVVIIKPNIHEKTYEINKKTKSTGIPLKLMESIMISSIKNQKKKLKNLSETIILRDGIEMFTNNRNQWLDMHINDALNDIKHELHLITHKLVCLKKEEESISKCDV